MKTSDSVISSSDIVTQSAGDRRMWAPPRAHRLATSAAAFTGGADVDLEGTS